MRRFFMRRFFMRQFFMQSPHQVVGSARRQKILLGKRIVKRSVQKMHPFAYV
jgi:hypothetical protein